MTPRPAAAKIRTASYPKRFHKRRSGLRCFIVRFRAKTSAWRVLAEPKGTAVDVAALSVRFRHNARAKNFSRGELIDRPRSARLVSRFILRFSLASSGRVLSRFQRGAENMRAKRRNRPSILSDRFLLLGDFQRLDRDRNLRARRSTR